MCCHEHPDNGSGLAVANVEDNDLLAQLREERKKLAAVKEWNGGTGAPIFRTLDRILYPQEAE